MKLDAQILQRDSVGGSQFRNRSCSGGSTLSQVQRVDSEVEVDKLTGLGRPGHRIWRRFLDGRSGSDVDQSRRAYEFPEGSKDSAKPTHRH